MHNPVFLSLFGILLLLLLVAHKKRLHLFFDFHQILLEDSMKMRLFESTQKLIDFDLDVIPCPQI